MLSGNTAARKKRRIVIDVDALSDDQSHISGISTLHNQAKFKEARNTPSAIQPEPEVIDLDADGMDIDFTEVPPSTISSMSTGAR